MTTRYSPLLQKDWTAEKASDAGKAVSGAVDSTGKAISGAAKDAVRSKIRRSKKKWKVLYCSHHRRTLLEAQSMRRARPSLEQLQELLMQLKTLLVIQTEQLLG